MTFLLLLLLTSSTATAGASTALQALRDSASTTIHNLTNQVVLQDAERSRQEAVRVLLTDPVESFPVLAKFVSELSAKERTALQGNESEEAAATYAVDS